MKLFFLSLFTLAIFSVNAQDALQQNNISVLRFQSTTEFKTFIETNSLTSLPTINGYGNFTPLKTTFPAEPTAPTELNDAQPDDDYNIKDDVLPVFNKNDYSNNYLLGDILNTDKVVAIGNWFIKIDLENDRALVLNTSFAAQYADLVSANTNNVNLLTYPLDSDGIDVLDLLDNPKGVDNGEIGAKCRVVRQNRSTSNYAYSSNRFRLRMEMDHQSFFFFHSLVVKSHTQKRLFRIWWHHFGGSATIPNTLMVYNIRCKDGCSQFSGPPSCSSGNYTTGHVCTYRPYSGWRRLPNYDFVVDFQSTNGNGQIELHDN